MLTLYQDEHILMVIRKHWFVMLESLLILLFLLIGGIIILSFLPSLLPEMPPAALRPLIGFLMSMYALLVLALLFLSWMDYHLDMWVITDKRIIDIEQRGLFHREMSDIPYERIQDITVNMKGPIQTFFRFGTIRIQTAGQREFAIANIPHLEELRDTLLRYAQTSLHRAN